MTYDKFEYDRGRKAFLEGRGRKENPNEAGLNSYASWKAGWFDAASEELNPLAGRCAYCQHPYVAHTPVEFVGCIKGAAAEREEARDTIRRVNAMLDEFNVPRESESTETPGIYMVVTHTLTERTKMFADAWSEERKFADVRAAGRAGYRTGYRLNQNPYELDTPAHRHWQAGWLDAQELENESRVKSRQGVD
jgi:hypothetical protein